MKKICHHCQQSFDITQSDLDFYDSVSPIFNEKKYAVPPPTLCPDCRMQRRLAWRNEKRLYHRKCDRTGKQILSIYSPDKPYTVYEVREWYKDHWNPMSSGRPFDFSRPFFAQFDELHRARQIPMLEGEETFELVREAHGWRVFLNWAGGIRVRFRAALQEKMPLQVTVSPEETLVSPGERVHVTLQATNRSTQDIVARVNHRIDPTAQADSLALLQCPLFIPVTLKPGQSEEFRSEYLLLKNAPGSAKQFQVTYEFSPVKARDRYTGK